MITAADIEVAIAQYYGYRIHLIVPNVSWGLGLHECDLLVVSGAGYATEIEIKISLADLKKDIRKRHHHIDHYNRIKKLYFAMPEKLLKHRELVPERAGIFAYMMRDDGQVWIKEIRPAKTHKQARALNQDELFKLAKLGAMRIWGLKNKIQNLQSSRYKT